MVRMNTISFSYQLFDSYEEMDPDDRDLVQTARETALNAYAPYSKFRVGAAIRLAGGTIVCGTNIENAAFPSGICAERNALANSLSNHFDDNPIALAIAAMTEDGLTDEPVAPCGNCRQALSEEELRTGKNIRIILAGKNKSCLIESINDLLPLQFNRKNMEVNLR